ncbi:hypothetical protein GA0070616_4602 [Micromonospora nigra]|uniref:Uncharacterized protein n=1 Tax=Micromonospora nigra TaxID=145857 RepID=A0A1C6STW2_9ACTN|nr:hypothetical protein [Micromonospora nigra]SCL32971.1 hypothetical protein GA0070616_4602 [Micromonospora nigra]
MSRHPILSRALIVSGVVLVLAILAHFGIVLPPEIAERVEEFAIVAGPVAVAWWAARRTTPISDPRDADGTPLVPDPAAGHETSGGAGAGSESPEVDASAGPFLY